VWEGEMCREEGVVHEDLDRLPLGHIARVLAGTFRINEASTQQ
jgi:hypothetical protein